MQLQHLVGHRGSHGGELAVAIVARSNRNRGGELAPQRALRHLHGRVPTDHVTGFMSQHAGKLRGCF